MEPFPNGRLQDYYDLWIWIDGRKGIKITGIGQI